MPAINPTLRLSCESDIILGARDGADHWALPLRGVLALAGERDNENMERTKAGKVPTLARHIP